MLQYITEGNHSGRSLRQLFIHGQEQRETNAPGLPLSILHTITSEKELIQNQEAAWQADFCSAGFPIQHRWSWAEPSHIS